MSSPPEQPRSCFGTPYFTSQANLQSKSDKSGMPGYKVFKKATDNFSEQHKLGSGQFGQVYKAHLPTGEVVAVKLLYQIAGFDDKQFSHKFSQLMSANHKNLVRLLGYSYKKKEKLLQYKGRAIRGANIHRLIGFEYVPGGSLANFLSDQHLGLNWDMRFKIIKGICEGLQYIHEAGIMHFDLKPNNILLDDENVPKITDFGLLKVLHEGTFKGTMRGTIEYIPPEFLISGEMSTGYDIFSLGAVIRRIVSGAMDYSSIADLHGRECVEHDP